MAPLPSEPVPQPGGRTHRPRARHRARPVPASAVPIATRTGLIRRNYKLQKYCFERVLSSLARHQYDVCMMGGNKIVWLLQTQYSTQVPVTRALPRNRRKKSALLLGSHGPPPGATTTTASLDLGYPAQRRKGARSPSPRRRGSLRTPWYLDGVADFQFLTGGVQVKLKS